MEIDLLREFIELANTLNFTETANKLFISRPVLSKHISSLEDQLGAALFVRSTHNVYLTDIGKLFLSDIKNVVRDYNDAVDHVHQALTRMEGELYIGFLDAAVRHILIPCVQRFKEHFPHTKIHLISYELGELDKAAKKGEVDIALTIQLANSVYEDEWRFEELYTDALAAMVPLTSPLAGRTSIKMADLRKEELVLPHPEYFPALAGLMSKLTEDAGFSSQFYSKYNHIDAASIMVETGAACTILPRHCEVLSHSNSCFIDLEDEAALFRVGALWNATNSNPIIPAFLDEIINFSHSAKEDNGK